MCELFGTSLKYPLTLNSYLKEFYSHCPEHPNGWGLALMNGSSASIEKEPTRADRSHYLKSRLSVPVRGKNVFAHIRRATIGNDEYVNCHPFTGLDASGRRWTLIHNGTIFEYEPMNRFGKVQKGHTDSERILLFIIDRMNQEISEKGELSCDERFAVLDAIICEMSKGNKLNLLLFDGECMYAHTNFEGSLHFLRNDNGIIFSTKPLSGEDWRPLPMTTLLGYREGELISRGTNHGNVYIYNEKDMAYIYLAFASL